MAHKFAAHSSMIFSDASRGFAPPLALRDEHDEIGHHRYYGRWTSGERVSSSRRGPRATNVCGF